MLFKWPNQNISTLLNRLNLKSNYWTSHQFQAFRMFPKQNCQNPKPNQRKSKRRMKWLNWLHGHPKKISPLPASDIHISVSGVRRPAHIRCPDVPTTDLPKVKPEKEEDKIAELAVSEYRHPKHLNFRRLIILLPASDNLTSVSGVINYLCLTFFFRILSSSSHLYLVISFLFST